MGVSSGDDRPSFSCMLRIARVVTGQLTWKAAFLDPFSTYHRQTPEVQQKSFVKENYSVQAWHFRQGPGSARTTFKRDVHATHTETPYLSGLNLMKFLAWTTPVQYE